MIEGRQRSSYRYAIAGLTVWAHLAAGLSFAVVSPVLPLISEDHGITHTSAGLLVGVVTLIQAAFGVPAGILVGRVGIKRTYSAALLLMGTSVFMVLSPGFAELVVLRLLFGLGMGIIFPATGPVIMQWFRPSEMSVVTSMNVVAMSLGMVVSVSTAVPLAGVLGGWENVMAVYGAVALAGGGAWMLWGRVEGGAAVAPLLSWKEIKAVLRSRFVLLLGVADAACFSQYMALAAWLPTFYHETRDMSLTQAGFITSLLPFTGIFAVLLGGFLPLKIGPRKLFLIVPGALAALGGLGSFLFDAPAITYLAVIVLGVGSWMYVPSLLTLPTEFPGMTPQRVAIVWGWITTVTGAGAFISPLAVGALRDGTGSYLPAFLIFAVIAWFLVVAGFMMPDTRSRRDEKAGPAPSPAASDD